MKFEIPEELIRETTKCEKNFKCLSEPEKLCKVNVNVDFKNSVISVGECISNLDKIRMDEKRYHERIWTGQTHEVNSINKNFSKILSNFETIMERKDLIGKKLLEKVKKKVRKQDIGYP